MKRMTGTDSALDAEKASSTEFRRESPVCKNLGRSYKGILENSFDWKLKVV